MLEDELNKINTANNKGNMGTSPKTNHKDAP